MYSGSDSEFQIRGLPFSFGGARSVSVIARRNFSIDSHSSLDRDVDSLAISSSFLSVR